MAKDTLTKKEMTRIASSRWGGLSQGPLVESHRDFICLPLCLMMIAMKTSITLRQNESKPNIHLMPEQDHFPEVREQLDSIVEAKRRLRELDVIRSERMVGEIGEWLAESIFGGERVKSTSQKGYDLIGDGRRVQVKTHAKGDENNARWTEFKYEPGQFDEFVIIVMSKELRLKEVYRIPEEIVFERIDETKKQRIVKWDDYADFGIALSNLPNQELVELFR